MATDSNNTFGFELLNKLYNDQVHRQEDVIILFVHWYLIKYGFKCVGLGDSKVLGPSERGSELLPEEWNTGPNYVLRYAKDEKLYILFGIKSEEDLLLNFLKVEDNNVSNIQFPIGQTVKELHGPLTSLIPSYEIVIQTLQKELVEPISPNNTRETHTQTLESSEEREPRQVEPDPLRVGPPLRPSSESRRWDLTDPTQVGAADLHPFARGGSGMLFDPFSGSSSRSRIMPGLGVPGVLPRGAVPPGARFDPFGPPDIERPRPPNRPDADHLPPPGYDDMFM